MAEPLQQGIARVRGSGSASVAGTAFLISPRHVLTCAHVVNVALNSRRWDSADRPATDATVQVEFPFARRGTALTASVVEWRPPADGVATDLAVLELDHDVAERPYRTIAGLPQRGQAFWTKGFPEGQDGGMDAAGQLGTPIEYDRLLAHGSALPGFFIEGGFSGAPLVDETTNGVIGMAAVATRDPTRRTAFIIPANQLELAWPPLARPYKGLNVFNEEDRRFFFGRDVFVNELAEKLARLPFVAVVGRSGSGKSSLVRAALLPRLHGEGAWHILVMRPGAPSGFGSGRGDPPAALVREQPCLLRSLRLGAPPGEDAMADEEQLRLLKQGVEAWNTWRRQLPDARVDLSGANLAGTNLAWANLRRANLFEANLSEANLSRANLREANLSRANLSRAGLSIANLREADLSGADLSGANLSKASLGMTILSKAGLNGANLSEALFREITLSDVDLSGCKNLETIVHLGPSPIDIRTLQLSGRLPLAFLRGVGLSDALIDYLPSLLNQAIQHYSCFISYSSKDDEFARRLHADLQDKGVRCWFAPEDMKIGAKILDTLDQAIRLRDKVLLVLSEASIASDWVEDEVTKAFAEERQRGVVVLFPVRLDDAVFATKEAWALKLRDNRNIGDFRAWKDHDAYQRTLERLLRDLRVETT